MAATSASRRKAPAAAAAPALAVEWAPIAEVRPYERNPRRNQLAVGKVAQSIAEFGWRQPIVVDERMVVLVGHTRLLAAKQLGMTRVPIHIARGLSATQAKAYRLADNRTADEAEWDKKLLALELKDLKLDGFDMQLTGFDFAELEDLTALDSDDTPQSPVPAGDLDHCWQLWAGEMRASMAALLAAGLSPFQGVTEGYALRCFLEAMHGGRDYPRHCSIAFNPHQVQCAAGQRKDMESNVMHGLEQVADGSGKASNLRMVLKEDMSARTLAVGALPFSGHKMPADFPAAMARDLYNEFASGGAVLDPCSGWGGRLVGYLLSSAAQYDGIDVSPQSVAGAERIRQLFGPYSGKPTDTSVTLTCLPFERWVPQRKYRFALTSPPYYDTEQYIGGAQCWKEYPTYDAWRDGFYRLLFDKVGDALELGGHFALQVGSQRWPLLEDGRRLAKAAGLVEVGLRRTDMINHQEDSTAEVDRELLLLLQRK